MVKSKAKPKVPPSSRLRTQLRARIRARIDELNISRADAAGFMGLSIAQTSRLCNDYDAFSLDEQRIARRPGPEDERTHRHARLVWKRMRGRKPVRGLGYRLVSSYRAWRLREYSPLPYLRSFAPRQSTLLRAVRDYDRSCTSSAGG